MWESLGKMILFFGIFLVLIGGLLLLGGQIIRNGPSAR
jgi:hypothetical protein